MKYILSLLVSLFIFFSMGFAQEYILFYGNGCPHCAEVEEYIKENALTKKFTLDQKEVFYNKANRAELNSYLAKHKLSYDKIGVPFLIIESGNDCHFVNGDTNIIDYFSSKLAQIKSASCEDTLLSGADASADSWKTRISFFGIMLPAAISDSINPCAFAVMLLLLSTILTRHKSRKKTLLA